MTKAILIGLISLLPIFAEAAKCRVYFLEYINRFEEPTPEASRFHQMSRQDRMDRQSLVQSLQSILTNRGYVLVEAKDDNADVLVVHVDGGALEEDPKKVFASLQLKDLSTGELFSKTLIHQRTSFLGSLTTIQESVESTLEAMKIPYCK